MLLPINLASRSWSTASSLIKSLLICLSSLSNSFGLIPWLVYSFGPSESVGPGVVGCRVESSDEGNGRCEIGAPDTVSVEVGGGEVAKTSDGMESEGKGKKRVMPWGSSSFVIVLPYDLGVRTYDDVGVCHV